MPLGTVNFLEADFAVLIRDVSVSPRERALDYFRTTAFAVLAYAKRECLEPPESLRSEWIGEVKKFIAGILKTSSICHPNAPAVFHREG
jgi:hypothetical protein